MVNKIDKFMSKVNKTDTCWIWRAGKNDKGYGIFYNGKTMYAHRYSYEWFIGPIPQNLTIDHLCRNKVCVNPDHLEAVTLQENINRIPRVYKEYCKNGHKFDYIDTRGNQRCRTCSRERQIKYTKNKIQVI